MLPGSPVLLHRYGLLRHSKPFSATAATSSPLRVPLSYATYMVWGANTSLGKTLVSAGLASSCLLSSSPSKFLYLKPLQTGFPSDSDSRFLLSKLSSLFSRQNSKPHLSLSLLASNSVLYSSLASARSLLGGRFEPNKCENGMCELGFYEERSVGGGGGGGRVSELVCRTVYAWEEAVSPHLAAEREGGVLEDRDVVAKVADCLMVSLEGGVGGERMDVFGVVETAGGVASPGPSGSLQCDLYRYVNVGGAFNAIVVCVEFRNMICIGM